MILLDTDIIIDVLREYPPAIEWLSTLSEEIILPGYSALELLQGCENKREMQKVEKFLQQITVQWLSETGCNKVRKLFAQLRLKTHFGMIDALIAQTAIEMQLPLHTFNLKHYRSVPNLLTVQPYKRKTV